MSRTRGLVAALTILLALPLMAVGFVLALVFFGIAGGWILAINFCDWITED